MKIIETSFKNFPYRSSLSSYSLFSFSPAITTEKDGGYSIRIITGKKENYNTGITRYNWDYFKTDSTGLITQSPRGMAKQFNGKYRYTDMDQAVEEYKEKRINQ